MSHIFEVTEEQYHVIEEVAREHGMAADDYFHAWVEAIQRHTQNPLDDAEQAWYWTPEWQEKEREADADLAAGSGEFFDSPEAFLASLDEAVEDLCAGASRRTLSARGEGNFSLSC